MKKISAVLLVLVLVGSVAFAGFTGSATSKFIADLDTGEFGFANSQAVVVDLVFGEALGSAKGKGDIYAEIAASFTFGYDTANDGDPVDVGTLDNSMLYGKVKFDYAKIVGDNWYVSILGSPASPNFVESAIDFDAADDAFDLVTGVVKNAAGGIEVGVADYKIGLAVPHAGGKNAIVKNASKYDVGLSVATPDFEFADGLTVAFGAGAHLTDANQKIFAALKTAYEVDDLAVTVAADLGYEVEGDFDAEVGVNAVYDFVEVDVYYATKAADATVYGNDPNNIVSLKAVANIDAFAVELTGKDLINTTDLGLSVDWDATDELSVNVNGGYIVQGVDEGYWIAGAGVTYTTDALEAKLSGSYDKDEKLGLAASVSSKALVDGALLKLEWKSTDLLNDVYGQAVASVKIAF